MSSEQRKIVEGVTARIRELLKNDACRELIQGILAGGDLLDRYHYFNADESFDIEVGNNYLAAYHYQPGTKHKGLRCEPSKQR